MATFNRLSAQNAGNHFYLDNPLPEGSYDPLDRGILAGPAEDADLQEPPRGRGRRRRRDDEDDDLDGIGENLADGELAVPDEDDEIPVYYHIPCSDVEEVIRELGRPGPRHKCFGCKYVGQNRAAKIPDSRLQEVFKTMADGIGVSWPTALAVQVSKQYESWRTIINETRGDRDLLPKWSPASVLDHWLNHTLDPEIIQWLDMTHLRYTVTKIRSKCLEKRNRFTGAEVHDREQFGIMRDAQRQFYFISSREPRKLSFYFDGAMIDRKSVANGGISRTGRPSYDFFKKGKRQRVAGGGSDGWQD